MTDKHDDGGPAFPQDEWHAEVRSFGQAGGMTLLDWFAGATLQALLVPAARDIADHGNVGDSYAADIARVAYSFARHMLAEKRRREEEPPK